MCAPVVIAGVVGAVASAAATAVSIKGQQDAANFKAAQARNNAQLAKQAESDAIQRGAAQARQIEIAGRRESASARAQAEATGARGASAENLIAGASIEAAESAEFARVRAARDAWGFRQEERSLKSQARAAKSAGTLASVGTGLSGFSQAGQQGLGAIDAGMKL